MLFETLLWAAEWEIDFPIKLPLQISSWRALKFLMVTIPPTTYWTTTVGSSVLLLLINAASTRNTGCVLYHSLCNTQHYKMTCGVYFASGSVMHQLLMAGQRLELFSSTKTRTVCIWEYFQYSTYQHVRNLISVPRGCFINRVRKKEEHLPKRLLMHRRLKARQDWTPYHISSPKCQERWGLGDPVHPNNRTQHFMSAGRAHQTVTVH